MRIFPFDRYLESSYEVLLTSTEAIGHNAFAVYQRDVLSFMWAQRNQQGSDKIWWYSDTVKQSS